VRLCGCALSGSKLQAAKGRPYLQCHPKTGGCGRIAIMLEPTEQYVADRVFGELDKPEFLDLVASDPNAARRDEITNELEVTEARRKELATLWGAGKLTNEEWTAARSALETTEQALQLELSSKPKPPERASIEQARRAWDFMELGERRQFLRLFVASVTIHPATPGLQRFDPGRIALTWANV
jgi:site-specific DNA recombinase